MILGYKCTDCNYCWNIEKDGNMSDRHYPVVSHGQWIVLMKLLLIPTADVNPSYVEVNFNNVCNMACSYCSPSLAVHGQKKQTI